MTLPPVPETVARAFSMHDAPVRARLLEIRAVLFALADEIDGVGPLTETLKWGEPAYLTEASGSGTTIRLAAVKSAPDACAVFFNCKTTLIQTFRAQFGDVFMCDGNRALLVPVGGMLHREPLVMCLGAALTYHWRKAR